MEGNIYLSHQLIFINVYIFTATLPSPQFNFVQTLLELLKTDMI